MEYCKCKDKRTWTNANGATVCLHCARLDPDAIQPKCTHERSKITPEGLVCTKCGQTVPLTNAFNSFKGAGLI